MSRRSRPVVHDLFAGAGLLSYAFDAEGFHIDQAVELDALAAQTYRSNLGDHIQVEDVRRVVPNGPCDVLVAGPPCQGFSTLGKRDPDDPRNWLSLEVLRWARGARPAIVVIENVAAFLDSPMWSKLATGLEQQGYDVDAVVLDAFDFGVPQRRARSFTFASRIGLPVVRRTGVHRSVRDAFEGLSTEPDGRNLHVGRWPTPLALARFKVIPPGGDRRQIMKKRPDLAPASWWRMGVEATDIWGRLKWHEPSNTLRTDLHPSKGRYIHPESHRVITLREAARLHSIPDSWMFAGERYPVARQLGNSVPPKLGRAVARAVARVIGF